MEKNAIVLLAEGFEEVEAITPIDYLRRAGVRVTTAAVGANRTVTGSHRIGVLADVLLGDPLVRQTAWDAVICPGGLPGSTNLAGSPDVGALLKKTAAGERLVGAICAAPATVLAPLGLLEGKTWTGYPGTEKGVPGGTCSTERVVRSGNLITSQGAGTAGLFACAIIDALLGAGEGARIAEKVLLG